MLQKFWQKCILIFTTLLLLSVPSLVSAKEKISFMYLYGETTEKYIELFEQTNGAVNVVSPNYFELDTNGSLVINVDPVLTQYMQKKQIKVVPYLSNHWDRNRAQLALNNPQKLAADLAQAVLNYNLDGVNVDLENLTFDDRQKLTYFVSLLKEKLSPHGKTVSIAVGAVDKPIYSGWKSAYELSNLSQVVDYMIVMAYDQHWQGSAPGPVAALPWVKSNLEYMLTQIPKEKLVLGIPFYGRYWTNGQGGAGIWYNNVIKAVAENNGTIEFHPEYRVPVARYTDSNGNYKEIWFENAQSLQEKINLVNIYGLKGVSAWRLGQEDPSIWKDYANWLYGTYFQDITNHWAKEDIIYLSERNIVAGRSAQIFAPDAGVTRAEAVAMLSRIFNWEISSTNPFTDVPDSHWAIQPILMAYKHSIVRGISADKFGPEQNLTRAQLAVILQRAFALEYSGEINYDFYDVPEHHWAAKEIYALKGLGLIAGRTLTDYAPEAKVTRAELAAMVARIIRE